VQRGKQLFRCCRIEVLDEHEFLQSKLRVRYQVPGGRGVLAQEPGAMEELALNLHHAHSAAVSGNPRQMKERPDAQSPQVNASLSGSEADKLSEQRPRSAALTKHQTARVGDCGFVTVRDVKDAIFLSNYGASYMIKLSEHAVILDL
jgi:hypothetical protein